MINKLYCADVYSTTSLAKTFSHSAFFICLSLPISLATYHSRLFIKLACLRMPRIILLLCPRVTRGHLHQHLPPSVSILSAWPTSHGTYNRAFTLTDIAFSSQVRSFFSIVFLRVFFTLLPLGTVSRFKPPHDISARQFSTDRIDEIKPTQIDSTRSRYAPAPFSANSAND